MIGNANAADAGPPRAGWPVGRCSAGAWCSRIQRVSFAGSARARDGRRSVRRFSFPFPLHLHRALLYAIRARSCSISPPSIYASPCYRVKSWRSTLDPARPPPAAGIGTAASFRRSLSGTSRTAACSGRCRIRCRSRRRCIGGRRRQREGVGDRFCWAFSSTGSGQLLGLGIVFMGPLDWIVIQRCMCEKDVEAANMG